MTDEKLPHACTDRQDEITTAVQNAVAMTPHRPIAFYLAWIMREFDGKVNPALVARAIRKVVRATADRVEVMPR